MPNPRQRYGIVVGVIPNANSTSQEPNKGFMNFWELESNGSVNSELAYHKPISDRTFIAKRNSNASRAPDVLPGMYVIQNEQQVGFAVTPLAVTMKATNRAQVRVGLVDDQVRIVCGLMQYYNSLGVLTAFNDGGYNTEERGITSYQGERAGCTDIGTDIFADDTNTSANDRSLHTRYKNSKARIIPKKRLQSFMGFLGDMFNFFIAKPDPTFNPETEADDNKDQGLLQIHTDASGRALVRSANGILFQRWDRIPIPKRKRQPYDPEGDKVELAAPPPPKTPFNWNTTHKYARNLEHRDGNAWRYLQAYWHLHNSAQSTGKKDFYLPEEQDLKVPDEQYDGPGKGTEKYAEYDKRQACIAIEEDGSIILRDAWGSEILMRGGNIIISAHAQAEVRSGKNTVIMGGHDLVLKGRQSVDMTATEKDVRIKADGNLHMLAEARNGGGGVLIESKSDGDDGTWDKKGEQSRGKGIVLKAKNSRVFAQGRKVHLSGEHNVMVETFGEDSGKNEGRIELSSSRIHTNSEKQTILTSGDESMLMLTKSSAYVCGRAAYLLAGKSAGIVKGSEVAIPLMWAPVGKYIYSDMQPRIDDFHEYLQGITWLTPYQPTNRKDVRFTYRTSAEYGTVKPSEITGAEKFYVYEGFWSYMARAGDPLAPVKPEPWPEYEIAGTKPWPGVEAWSGSFVTLDNEVNVEAATGIANRRSGLKDHGGTLTPHEFSEYAVIPHS
jgi:hypothetical protein